jgi:hypothetical protein
VIAAVITIEDDIAFLERVPILRRLGAGALIGILLLLFGMRWLRKACSSIVLRKRMNSWWRWRMTPCGVSSAGVRALDGYAPAVKEG